MEYKIYTGTLIAIKKGFLKGKFRFMYCGMPNDSTFALSPFFGHGYQGHAPTVYYNVSSRVIHLLEKDFEVIEVNADYIILGD